MGFSNLSSPAGLDSLNTFLVEKTYIEGTNPSQADVVVYKAVGTAPDSAKYPNAARWYTHITSYEPEFATLAGDKDIKLESLGPAAAAAAAAADEDDDDVDLFGSDDEEADAEAEKIKQERLAAYEAKKAAKGPKPAAKSIVTLEVKVWDDSISLDEVTENVKKIEMEGLTWGGHQYVAVGFGIKKLQINVVIVDEQVSVDDLVAEIEEDEDRVQSVDVAAMQKL